ncbi:hypothetical protein [Clostridium botulinum]|uniref:hypothetical protein n=1 Tax=Clostridium botulinum TaxID=1491 RepID=UPI001C9AF0EF|nr:hypothetical protein [Clostridium botulinum]MBY6900189.1 hypothetical protein [Clostridium botulinum]MBY6914302.1 hypothetical protein [Clostridium botulinum]
MSTTGEILYNVKKVILTPLDPFTGLPLSGGKPINIQCDSEVETDPEISQGQEKQLRDDQKILATASTPDLLYGYKLKMKNTTFELTVAALIEGGIIRYDKDDPTKIVGYDTPMLSEGSKIKPFKADIFVANYEGEDIKNYAKVTFNKCTGKAFKMGFKKDFFSPEFEVKCRENTKAKLPIKSIEFVDSLPQDIEEGKKESNITDNQQS